MHTTIYLHTPTYDKAISQSLFLLFSFFHFCLFHNAYNNMSKYAQKSYDFTYKPSPSFILFC